MLHWRERFQNAARVKIKTAVRELHPRQTFRIARANRDAVSNVFVKIEADDICGFGEASPNSFYGESAEVVLEKLASATPQIESLAVSDVASLERAWTELWPLLAPSRAAQCAIDVALWDWLAKRRGISVAELAWAEPPRPVPTFCTIGISDPAELEQKLAELSGFPFIKIKSDSRADLATLRLVRERSAAVLAVDANGAWSAADLAAHSAELARLGVRFIEQPLAPGCDAQLRRGECGVPVFADESCAVEEHIPRIATR